MNYNKAFSDLSNAIKLSHVWTHQAYHEISSKYRRTALGSLWISGSMIATALSMAIIFGGIFGQNLTEAFPFILAGLICFGLVAFPLSEGQEAFMANAGIIRNHAYPFMYYIFEVVCKNFFMALHHLVIFIFAIIIVGAFKFPHWSILIALPLVLTNMIVWSTITAMVASRFRDLRYLLPYIGQLMAVITPIFWQANQLHGWRVYIVHLNPLWGLVEILRSPLLGTPAPKEAWILALISLTVGIVSWLIFFPVSRRRIPFWI